MHAYLLADMEHITKGNKQQLFLISVKTTNKRYLLCEKDYNKIKTKQIYVSKVTIASIGNSEEIISFLNTIVWEESSSNEKLAVQICIVKIVYTCNILLNNK